MIYLEIAAFAYLLNQSIQDQNRERFDSLLALHEQNLNDDLIVPAFIRKLEYGLVLDARLMRCILDRNRKEFWSLLRSLDSNPVVDTQIGVSKEALRQHLKERYVAMYGGDAGFEELCRDLGV